MARPDSDWTSGPLLVLQGVQRRIMGARQAGVLQRFCESRGISVQVTVTARGEAFDQRVVIGPSWFMRLAERVEGMNPSFGWHAWHVERLGQVLDATPPPVFESAYALGGLPYVDRLIDELAATPNSRGARE